MLKNDTIIKINSILENYKLTIFKVANVEVYETEDVDNRIEITANLDELGQVHIRLTSDFSEIEVITLRMVDDTEKLVKELLNVLYTPDVTDFKYQAALSDINVTDGNTLHNLYFPHKKECEVDLNNVKVLNAWGGRNRLPDLEDVFLNDFDVVLGYKEAGKYYLSDTNLIQSEEVCINYSEPDKTHKINKVKLMTDGLKYEIDTISGIDEVFPKGTMKITLNNEVFNEKLGTETISEEGLTKLSFFTPKKSDKELVKVTRNEDTTITFEYSVAGALNKYK